MPAAPPPERTSLRLLVADGGEALAETRFARGFEAPPPAARPADRCEPWPIVDGRPLRALVAAAATCGVSPQLAAVLLVERGLLAAELDLSRLDERAARLDAAADLTRVTVELSEPLSAYLAALSGRGRDDPGPLPRVLPLPMRLTERILAQPGQLALDAPLLPSALSWERAAVLEGRTMSEWAALRLLTLAR